MAKLVNISNRTIEEFEKYWASIPPGCKFGVQVNCDHLNCWDDVFGPFETVAEAMACMDDWQEFLKEEWPDIQITKGMNGIVYNEYPILIAESSIENKPHEVAVVKIIPIKGWDFDWREKETNDE